MHLPLAPLAWPVAARRTSAIAAALLLSIGACSLDEPANLDDIEGNTNIIYAPYGHTIYLDFDGAELVPGPADDSHATPYVSALTNVTEPIQIPPMDTTYIGGDSAKEAIRAAVESHFAGMNVRIVTERPHPQGDYRAVVVGGQPFGGRQYAGVAPLVDCRVDNPNAVVHVASDYAVERWRNEYSVTDPLQLRLPIATAISHEIRHTLGLGHDDDPMSIMFFAAVPGQAEYATFKEGMVFMDDPNCRYNHFLAVPTDEYVFCGDNAPCDHYYQNGYLVAMDYYGMTPGGPGLGAQCTLADGSTVGLG